MRWQGDPIRVTQAFMGNSRRCGSSMSWSSLNGGGMDELVLCASVPRRSGSHGHDASITSRCAAGRWRSLSGSGRCRPRCWAGVSPRLRTRLSHFSALHPPSSAHNPTALHYATIGKLAARAHGVFTDHAQTRGSSAFHRASSGVKRTLSSAVRRTRRTKRAARSAWPASISVIHNGIDITPAGGRATRCAPSSALAWTCSSASCPPRSTR